MVSAGINFGSSRRTRVDLAEELQELKRERNAVILAHNYQVPELQDAADFVGDSLGLSYQAAKTDADVILFCGVEFTARSINRIREQYPNAPVVAHPECTYAVRMLADEVCSTEKMVTFCRESLAREIIVVTEAGLLHRLSKEIPNKTFIPGPTDNCFCGECRFMKMNTLEKAYDALLNMEPEITLPEPLRKRAELPIRRMLELSR